MTKILGVDPGFERLGLAVLEKNKNTKEKEQVVFSECFKTSSKLEFKDRLLLIGEKIKKIIKKYKPEILSIETLFLNTNQKTVMRVAEVRGVVIYEATKAGLAVFEASPPQIKMATTGYGGSDKTQIIKMVKMLVKIDDSKTRPNSRNSLGGRESDDELDAIAIALTASANLKTLYY